MDPVGSHVGNEDSAQMRSRRLPASTDAVQTTGAAPWNLVKQRLFPDYNAAAIIYWCLLVAAGTSAIGASIRAIVEVPRTQLLEMLLIAVIAALVALFPLRIPRSKHSIAAGDVFIFLMLLLHGPCAAALAAAAESAVCSWRTSKRWSSRIASPAAAAVAMLVCGEGFAVLVAHVRDVGLNDDVGTFAALMVFASAYFFVSPTLITTVIFLKRARAPSMREWFESFGYLGLGYAGSASVTAVLYLAFRQFGVSTVVYATPMIGLFLATLHYYFARQEAEEREVAERTSRERAEAAERAAAQAALHLRELEASDKRFHSAFTHAAIGMALVSGDGIVLQVNRAMCALVARDEHEAIGGQFRNLLNPLDAAHLENELRRIRGRQIDRFQAELRLRHADGREIWASLHCGLFSDAAGNGMCLIFQAFDVTARRLAESRLQHMAYHDGLTNLANRSRLHEALTQAIEAKRQDPARSFALMCMTFDRIKLLNDSFGLSAVDQALMKIARRLKERVGAGDVVARLGGDQFAILTPCHGRGHDAAFELARKLQAAFAEPFEIEGTEVTTGVSIGVTLADVGYLTPEEALRDADLARQRAKAGGHSEYVVFDANLHERAKERLLLEAELRRAIAANQMSLVFQPIFEIESQSVVGFEALARWEHAERGPVAPSLFIPVAEDSGLIGLLTQWAMRRACQSLRDWLDAFPALQHLYVNVNISGHDLCDPKFAETVRETLAHFRLMPASLTLEITESTLMHQLEAGSRTLGRLRELGVGLSVDDFGTGYSSLSYLSALPVNSLKIDRSFVSRIDGRADDAEIVRAVVQLGDALGKRVVAEGIETVDQLERLRQIGCEFGQGYLLSRPIDAARVVALLESFVDSRAAGYDIAAAARAASLAA